MRRKGRGAAPEVPARPLRGRVFLHVLSINRTLFALGWKNEKRLITVAQSGKGNASKGKRTKRGQLKSGGCACKYFTTGLSNSEQNDGLSCWLD